jgi:hypothetical protein
MPDPDPVKSHIQNPDPVHFSSKPRFDSNRRIHNTGIKLHKPKKYGTTQQQPIKQRSTHSFIGGASALV